MPSLTKGLTPVEHRDGLYFKRDDLFTLNGACGGKLRAVLVLAENATGLVGCSPRQGSQCAVVAAVADGLGLPCSCHFPAGEESPSMAFARRKGAEILAHRPGYMTVIKARARDDAKQRNWKLVPFGMECREMVAATAEQVSNLPFGEFNRLVVTVGSGMSLCGILTGLKAARKGIQVMAVRVGSKDTEKRLDAYAPSGWRKYVTFEDAPEKSDKLVTASLSGIDLDAAYEAKVARYTNEGDLFWIIGKRPE